MTEPTWDEDDLSAPPDVEGGCIAGEVTDFAGLPLVGVRVEAAATGGADLDLLPTLTDGDGRFALEGLAPGRYDLRFVLGRVRARTLAVPVGTDQLRVRLARPQGILLVAKTEEGAPPPEVLQVRLDRRTPTGRLCEYFGRHLRSRMLLWSIRPGTYTLTAWGGPYLPVEADGIEVLEGQAAPEVQVLLAAQGATLRGTARSAEGGVPPDLLVAWRRLEAPGPWPRRTQSLAARSDGTFAIRGLPSGRYRISVGSERGPLADREVEVTAPGTHEVEVVLP